MQYRSVDRWDGKLPQYMGGGAVPFIDITRKAEGAQYSTTALGYTPGSSTVTVLTPNPAPTMR